MIKQNFQQQIISMRHNNREAEKVQMVITQPTAKELLNNHLFQSAKQINGDISFKKLHAQAIAIHFNKRIVIPQQYFHGFFSYVVTGQVFIYKKSNKRQYKMGWKMDSSGSNYANQKIFITCHKSHEVFGLQEYPLNWVESMYAEASENCKIFVFPLDLSLSCFKKIFTLSMLQFKTELLKKSQFFKEIQIQKLKKIALHSYKYQGNKNQLLIKGGTSFETVFLLIEGECSYLQQQTHKKRYYKKGDLIGMQFILHEERNKPKGVFSLSCLNQCQFLSIPKNFVERFNNIKYRLEDKESILIFSGGQNQFERNSESHGISTQHFQRQKSLKYKDINEEMDRCQSVFFRTEPKEQIRIKYRPFTSGNYKINRSQTSHKQHSKDPKQNTFYHSTANEQQHTKTQSNDLETNIHNFQFNQRQSTDSNISLGELCLRKFVSRKQKRENSEVMKYLKSNAPELKLNPYKQYALVKPLHVSDSHYIKNLKRKLKRNYFKFKENKQDEKNTANNLNFFMKQDFQT